ncbi:hypothetical protein IWW55_001319 [Coemansia sp. RSA 2706]|nr:hypothetical protein LPJ63_003252 [Coemansia sp. RSA 2711]KAJ1847699.1 hypothetical protein LPJ70_001402 [Coemansia sp. RSA 2708]KAJ2306724.1 hypothetical protein IWW55_001319 [Coemansia sp. RSA 2706]KAJ2312054.1 hypothetical protein IWW54_002310 [Coemansia sp. RSA 2705]KAJ2321923.1 hypothetical protein IWW52_000424 [Coemansia sp. RSA 2704]KAJ2328419.1 hypothetical protein IWW51_001215 [Coemansia sp. RSA 2702]KAJ2362840.1 hypothetical protein H4S01_004591 [Coemansia sp. RSA 2610]KAJ273822
MQFVKSILAIAAVAASVSAQSVDWTADSTVECSYQNWAAIKAKADPMIPMAGVLLSQEQMSKLYSIIGEGATTMPATVTKDQIRELPQAIPPNLLDSTVLPIIQDCLATVTAEVPSASEEPSSPAEESPAESSDAEVPSGEPTDAPTDAPAESSAPEASATKCIPRN